MIQVLLSWSGGKDAAWALHALRSHGDCEIVGLLTTLTEGFDRVSMQGIRREILHAQARATRLPVTEVWIPQVADNGVYSARMAQALAQAQQCWPALRHVAFGDLLLADVRAWREAQCARIGWTTLFPLFGQDTAAVARQMLAGGLRAELCCVDTSQLDASHAGRRFDVELLDTLPAGVDPCGENGEFHTCVHTGPMFERPVAVERGETVLRDGRFAYTDFTLRL